MPSYDSPEFYQNPIAQLVYIYRNKHTFPCGVLHTNFWKFSFAKTDLRFAKVSSCNNKQSSSQAAGMVLLLFYCSQVLVCLLTLLVATLKLKSHQLQQLVHHKHCVHTWICSSPPPSKGYFLVPRYVLVVQLLLNLRWASKSGSVAESSPGQ